MSLDFLDGLDIFRTSLLPKVAFACQRDTVVDARVYNCMRIGKKKLVIINVI